MKLARKIYTTRREKVVDFIIGIVGWHVINIAMTLVGFGLASLLSLIFLVPSDNMILPNILIVVSLLLQCVPWLVNIALLIYFGVTRHWIALGALATIGFYILLTICAAVVFAVLCATNQLTPK